MEQPIQEYFLPFTGQAKIAGSDSVALSPMRFFSHIGTDNGMIGPGVTGVSWNDGQVCIDLEANQWVGLWHRLTGVAGESVPGLDFERLYPSWIRDEYQPRCVGIQLRAAGEGRLKLEIKSSSDHLVWFRNQDISTAGQLQDFRFDLDARDLRDSKQLTCVAEPHSHLCIDSIELLVEYPSMPFPVRMFLISYAKLSLCTSLESALVKDRANFAAGEFESIPASGLFCLATCAAWDMNLVERGFALERLRKVHGAVSSLRKPFGVLPHFVRKSGVVWEIHPGTEYSTIDTSLYYHSMLLAAQMLGDKETLDELVAAIRRIEFTRLRDRNGNVIHGLREDGQTRLTPVWKDWGGETALVILLERMSSGKDARMKMEKSGHVFGGRGFIAEIQSLFYPHFSRDSPDRISGVNWLQARRQLLAEQRQYTESHWRNSKAAELNLYGLSAGEGHRGIGYIANGTHDRNVNIIHPHYVFMAALSDSRLENVYSTLKTMEEHGLIFPFGTVENFAVELDEYLPYIGSLNASFESISAYHIWSSATRRENEIYRAARTLDLTSEAISQFYTVDD